MNESTQPSPSPPDQHPQPNSPPPRCVPNSQLHSAARRPYSLAPLRGICACSTDTPSLTDPGESAGGGGIRWSQQAGSVTAPWRAAPLTAAGRIDTNNRTALRSRRGEDAGRRQSASSPPANRRPAPIDGGSNGWLVGWQGRHWPEHNQENRMSGWLIWLSLLIVT